MEHLIDKIAEALRLMKEVEEQVTTCSINHTSMEWHIFNYYSFIKVANELNGGMFREVDTGSGPYHWRYEFECRGVTVFCLSHYRMEVPTDA